MLRLIGLFLVTAVNFVMWWWTTTPYYAVSEIRDSLKNHDLDRFERYVDVESVASKMIDGLNNPNVRKALGNGVLGRMIGSGVVTMMKPQLIELIRNEVTNFVERNDLQRIEMEQKNEQSLLPLGPPRRSADFQSALGPLPSGRLLNELAAYNYKMPGRIPSRGLNFFKDVHLHLGFGRKSFRGVSYMRQIGHDCLLGLLMYNQRFERMLLLELKLSRKDGNWQIVEVSNFPQFLCTLITLEKTRAEQRAEARELRQMREQMEVPRGEIEEPRVEPRMQMEMPTREQQTPAPTPMPEMPRRQDFTPATGEMPD